MTCAEFQRVLPYIIDTGGNAEQEEHLRTCPVCSDLVADLKYIADQAKLLVPMEDPSPRVWDGLQKSLEREGLVKSAPARRPLLVPHRLRWGWLMAAAAVVILGFVSFFLFGSKNGDQSSSGAVNVSSLAPGSSDNGSMDSDDQQLLQVVAENRPEARADFEQGLREVNASISEALHSVEQDPNDEDARQFLMQAYEQKNMLYKLATQ